MSPRTRFAFWIYLLLMIAGAAWGIGFLLRSEFTPYHGAAAGVPWSEVPPNFQIVILALTKLAGGLWVAFTLCIFVLLLLPFRRGERWALWAVPLLMLAQYAAPMPAMTHLTVNSPASPPWALTISCMVVTLVALLVSVTGPRRA
ncbi:MAG TPA: hypothetical protein VFV27_03595 [Nevskiaceae bacterium]|nr:hypothetical protein [Nevskiaceae bacterium]